MNKLLLLTFQCSIFWVQRSRCYFFFQRAHFNSLLGVNDMISDICMTTLDSHVCNLINDLSQILYPVLTFKIRTLEYNHEHGAYEDESALILLHSHLI